MKALILDFDGLILDTETTDFESWRVVYQDHGVTLPRDEWVEAIPYDQTRSYVKRVLRSLHAYRVLY